VKKQSEDKNIKGQVFVVSTVITAVDAFPEL